MRTEEQPTGLTRIETHPPEPRATVAATAARERSLSRLLMVYIATGLAFMLLPGTFLGVWNLFAISSRHAPDSIPAAWIQAHGHAQIFGWIGTFILGIGFYSIPKLRRLSGFALPAAWTSWALWTAGATLRWLAGVYGWHWRLALPVSAALELASFLIFFRCVSGHRPEGAGKSKLEAWVLLVIAGSVGLLWRWRRIWARQWWRRARTRRRNCRPPLTCGCWRSRHGAAWFCSCGVSARGGCRCFWDCGRCAHACCWLPRR